MSAIWGRVCFSESTSVKGTANVMRTVYEEKCRLDDIQEIDENSIYMACGLQHITQYSVYEKLPYHAEQSDCFFTADCVLDNRQQLKKRLGIDTADVNSIPDGMLVFLMYEKYGMDCLNYLKGLFSFAVYDKKNQVVYLASDPTASRCLYYYKSGNDLLFSTLLEPILRICPDIKENVNYLKDFITAPGLIPNIVSNETPYENVYKLNPGVCLECKKNTITEHEYFDISKPLTDCKCKSAKQYGTYFRNLYRKCVKAAINTRGEVGISLSSGLDSASVGVLAADLIKKEQKTLYSYTYVTDELDVSDNDKNHVLNEQKDVLEIVNMHPNIKPHFLNNEGKNCLEDTEKCVDIMEIPFKACVNLPNLCEIYEKAAQQGCRVVLTGQCGNSTVSYSYIDNVLYDFYKNKRFIHFLLYLNNYSKTVGESRKAALRGCYRYFEYAKKAYNNSKFEYKPDNPFLNMNVLENYPLQERYEAGGTRIFENIPVPQEIYRINLYKKAMYTYLGELDTKMGLKYNILLRDPTRDSDMLRFCYNLPYKYFAYKGVPRWLIRGNLKDVLPDYMISKWMRYCVQNADWFERIKRDWTSVVSKLRGMTNIERLYAYMDKDRVLEFLGKPEKGMDINHKTEIIYLLYLYVLGSFLEIKKRK